MPRAKPDQVITHRIELGTWERDELASLGGMLVASESFENVAGPIVKVLTDTSTMAILLTALAAYAGFNWVQDQLENTPWGMFESFREQYAASDPGQQAKMRAAMERGAEEGSPLPNFIDRWLLGLIL